MVSDYLNFDTVGVNINYNGKPSEIATPQSICNDMTSLFNYENCNKKLWADLYCKTGNTLIALKQNGVNTSNIIAICENEQSQMFACRKLYGQLLLEEEVELKDDMKPYYKITRRGQVYYICGWKDIVKRNISAAHKLIQNILKEMRETMSLEWVEQDKDFGIDNVIMNPPYNNDMYIDFVELAQNVAKESVVAITPAKWQAKGGEKNGNFRENIVPYMKEIVYYPDCIQVFGISENSGITYFSLDKDVHIKKEICNKAYFQPLIDSKVERELNTNDTLWNCGQAIINKIQEKNERRFKLEYIQEDSRKQYTICVGKQWCGSRLSSGAWDMNTSQIKKEYIGKGGCIFNPNGTIKVLGKVVGLKDDEFDTSNSSICIFTSDNEEEAISFYSFINTKLFSFLILINLKGSIIFDDLTLKYIPDPGAFDHIFTDEELYKKYNLTNEEINIIESVIKDRK